MISVDSNSPAQVAALQKLESSMQALAKSVQDIHAAFENLRSAGARASIEDALAHSREKSLTLSQDGGNSVLRAALALQRVL